MGGQKFDPDKDILNLSGKVLLVTGGTVVAGTYG